MSGNDGGPAFPIVPDDHRDCAGLFDSGYGGMSLRDWLAGQALIALFAASAHPQHCGIARKDYDDAGLEAYELADAILAAREASNG